MLSLMEGMRKSVELLRRVAIFEAAELRRRVSDGLSLQLLQGNGLAGETEPALPPCYSVFAGGCIYVPRVTELAKSTVPSFDIKPGD